MPMYRVYLQANADLTIKVEADDPEDAIEKAFEESPSGVCAGCSGWGQKWGLDIGEFELVEETDYETGVKTEVQPELIED